MSEHEFPLNKESSDDETIKRSWSLIPLSSMLGSTIPPPPPPPLPICLPNSNQENYKKKRFKFKFYFSNKTNFAKQIEMAAAKFFPNRHNNSENSSNNTASSSFSSHLMKPFNATTTKLNSLANNIADFKLFKKTTQNQFSKKS